MPLSEDVKKVPYAQRPAGLPGIDALLPLLMGAVKNGRLGFEDLVQMCSETPARLFGLNDGRIHEGAAQTCFSFERAIPVDSSPRPPHLAYWSPFLGREVGLLPEVVVAEGRLSRGKVCWSTTYRRGARCGADVRAAHVRTCVQALMASMKGPA